VVDTFPFFGSNNLIGIFILQRLRHGGKIRYYAFDSGQANYSFLPLTPEIFPLKVINIIFFSFRVVLYCADSPICYTVCLYTYIYIYIYIYIAYRALWFPNFYILFVYICRTSWVREEPEYLIRCTYRIQAHHFKNHSPIPGSTREFIFTTLSNVVQDPIQAHIQ